MSDAAASDDSDLRNIVHAGTPLTATSLAIAERNGANGEAVLTAMVCGYEAAGRISEAITPGFRDRGFHGCLGAIFAAAVAAGRLLRLDAPQMAQAIALSATSIGGLATAANTSVAREYHAGLAAMLGVNAALAAQRGYLAEESILETRRGFFEAFGGVDGAAAGAIATRDLGQSWDIVTDMAIKLVPGGHPYHALGEAAANAARDGHDRRGGRREHHGVASRHDRADRSAAPDRSDRHGAQPGLLRRRRRGRPRLFLGARERGKDRRPGHSSADRQDRRRRRRQPRTMPRATGKARPSPFARRDGRISTSTVYAPKGAAALGIAWGDVDAQVPHPGACRRLSAHRRSRRASRSSTIFARLPMCRR